MADRNVNVRLQVIDGGKVKAELQSVGTAGAAALDALQQKSQQAGASVNRLASHEVGNLAAQLSDIGVSLASGQSPFTVMIQQGAQISQIMGDRGVRGIVGALGQGLLSLINPTTLALGGIVAAGYAASFAIDALTGDSEDLNDVLDESKQLTDDLTRSMDGAGKGAENFAQQIREVATLQASENLRKLTEAYQKWSAEFASSFTMPTLDPLGNATGFDEINQRFAPFEEAIRRFQATVAAGRPDVEGFAQDVAEIGNATPELAKMAVELVKAAEKGGEYHRAMDIAAARTAYLAGTATDAQLALLGLSNTLKNLNDGINVIRDIQNEMKLLGDEREQFIASRTRGLEGGSSWILDQARREAGALYDQREQLEASTKATRDFKREQERLADRLKADGQRVYEETRTAAESYANEIARLNDLLAKGAIDQETYGRAAANAAEDLAKAERGALDKATDAGSGFTRAFDDYLKSAADMATATENLTNNVLDGLGDAMAQFVTTGKLNFKDLTNSILADLARLATQRLLSMLLSSFLPGGGGISYGNAGGTAGILPAIHHGGGMVGAGGAFGRMFPAEAFLNAPRFHNGGGFFAADERPAILQVGERVLSRAEVAAGDKPSINVKVVNNVAGNVESRTEMLDERNLLLTIDARVSNFLASERSNTVMRAKNGIAPRRTIRGA